MTELRPVSFKKGRAHLPRLSPVRVPSAPRHRRFWTDAEDAILRQHYPKKGGLDACEQLLPNRETGAIRQRAAALKVRAPGNPSRGRITVPDDIDDIIREEWARLDGKERGAVRALATKLKVPRHWLSVRARNLGLTLPGKKEPPWTAAELALLQKAPLHDPNRAAALFRRHGFQRTATSIVVKAKRLAIARSSTRETMSALAAAAILGIDSKAVGALCMAGDLKATKRRDRRLPQQGGSVWDIHPADLRGFIIRNLERVDFRKVDKFKFVHLLIALGRRAPWTGVEDEIIADGYKRKRKVIEIIEQLQAEGFRRRTVEAITTRARSLGCTKALQPAQWSPTEDKIIKDGYRDDKTIETIRRELKKAGCERTHQAVQLRAIKLSVTGGKVNHWKPEEVRIALAGLRAGKVHRVIRDELKAAGFWRGPTALFKFAQKHGVVRKRDPWTDEHKRILRERYAQNIPPKEIAKEIGKPVISVRCRASEMGLKLRKPWTGAEQQILIDTATNGGTLIAAQKRIGRKYPAVARMAFLMGLTFKKTGKGAAA